jgi:hypothetical protein
MQRSLLLRCVPKAKAKAKASKHTHSQHLTLLLGPVALVDSMLGQTRTHKTHDRQTDSRHTQTQTFDILSLAFSCSTISAVRRCYGAILCVSFFVFVVVECKNELRRCVVTIAIFVVYIVF